jgi:methylenetetrahydrofolate dehydrogenase (NADP+)/methenyltetrahydrofolate cyclohydrolase
MTARTLDGASVARAIREEVAEGVAALRAKGVRPGLGVVLVGEDPASALYVANKARVCEDLGMHHETVRLPASTTTDVVERAVAEYNGSEAVHGILVQLPLPPHVDAARVLSRVDPRKDVDGFHPENVGLLVQKRPRFIPCTPAGIMELLDRNGIAIGGSDIVGKPMALLLLHRDATVTIAHSRTPDLPDVTRRADILVAAVGRAGIIGTEHVKPGAVVVDVGMNRVEDPAEAERLLEGDRLDQFRQRGRALVGDVRFPEVRQTVSAITPVPGGVGPLTIALLMRNTVAAAGLTQ